MFHQKKVSIPWLLIEDDEGKALFDEPMEQLQLPEEIVLKLSQEFFDDPAPCPIHRNAVAVRALAELQVCLEAEATLPMSGLPARVAAYLGAYPRAARLYFRQELR